MSLRLPFSLSASQRIKRGRADSRPSLFRIAKKGRSIFPPLPDASKEKVILSSTILIYRSVYERGRKVNFLSFLSRVRKKEIERNTFFVRLGE